MCFLICYQFLNNLFLKLGHKDTYIVYNELFLTTFLHLISGKHSAQWALDDVLIGMNDSSQTGFQDKFDGSIDLQANWYRIQGGQVGIDCLSMDTALIFTENMGMYFH